MKVLLLIIVVVQVACSATIRKTDGTIIKARIIRSDNSAIYVMPSDLPDEVPKETTIPRSEIAVIDDLSNTGTWTDQYRIMKKDGTVIVAKIVRKDSFSVTIAIQEPPKGLAIARSDIADIDHPGNVARWIATPLALVGWVWFVVGMVEMPRGPDVHGEQFAIGFLEDVLPGIAIAVPSTIISAIEWISWGVSVSAAAPPEGINITPVALTDGRKMYFGLGMGWRW